MPEGRVIDVVRRGRTVETSEGAQVLVSYEPRWNHMEPNWRFLPTTRDALVFSVEQVLNGLVEDGQPELSNLQALTSFQVRAMLYGEERSYRAAFLWISESDPPTWDSFEFVAVDNITQGVDTAVREGSHLARPELSLSCTCTGECRSICDARVVRSDCYDSGITYVACHRMAVATDGSTQAYINTPTSCAAGFFCAKKNCTLCTCALAVSVQVQGVSVQYSGGEEANWTHQRAVSYNCPICVGSGGGGGGGGGDGGCVPLPESGQVENPGLATRATCPASPILVALSHPRFQLTGLEGGVDFDLDADGELERVAWTEAQADNAWLALDRNGNGLIDDGRELFGNFTPQPPSQQPNGYLALAVFDLDGDGVITAADPVFAELRLWKDSNHDGISQATELSTLADLSVQSIRLDYVESRWRDRWGNQFRYEGRVYVDGPGAPFRRSADVFLLLAGVP